MRILLAFNGTKLSDTALQTVIAQYRPQNAEVNVLYVVPADAWVGEGSQPRELVDRAGQALRTAGFKVETTVLKGATSDAIIDAAVEWNADLIVLGWHGRAALKRFLLGSMSEAVIHDAPCSVELVRMHSLRCESEACRRAEGVAS